MINRLNIIFLLFCLFLSPLIWGQRFAVISDIHGASSNTLDVSNLVKSKKNNCL